MEGKNRSKKDIFDDVYMFSLIIVLLSIVFCGLGEISVIKRQIKSLKPKDEEVKALPSFLTRTITVKFDLDEVRIGN